MRRKSVLWAILILTVLVGGSASYLAPRLTQATPLSNANSEPKSLSDIVNFTKISNLRETTLTPLSADWENALTTIQQYPGTAAIYAEGCFKYSCPGGVPETLTKTPQALLPQKLAALKNAGFGNSVAMAGNSLLVGVPYDSTAGILYAGAAYLFDTSGNLLKTFQEPIPAYGDYFGWSVAGVGSNILIGSKYTVVGGFAYAGAAYLFDTSGNLLKTFQEPSPGAGDQFGQSVAGVGSNILIGSAFTMVGGATGAGAAYLFDTSGNLLATFHEPNFGPSHYFGYSVTSVGGNVLVGAPTPSDNGAAYLFDTSGNLLATFPDGWSVSSVGSNVLVSSPTQQVAYLFDTSGNLLTTFHEPTPAAGDLFGWSETGVGSNVLIGSRSTAVGGFSGAGAAYLFDTSGNVLKTFHEPMPATNDFFGWSVASVGSSVLISSPETTVGGLSSAGAAYLFDTSGNLLRTIEKVARPAFGFFGSSFAGIGGNLIVGAPGDNNSAGVAYVLDSSGTIVRTFQKPVPVPNDNFGQSIASVGPNIFVGAPDDSSPTSNGGAVYVFDNNGNLLATLRNPGANVNNYFGYSLAAIGADILVGAPGDGAAPNPSGAGAAYLFDSNGALLRTFYEPARTPNEHFGQAVASVGANILIGSPGSTVGGFTSAGAAYLFDLNGNLLATYHEPTSSANDNFGSSVAGVGGNILVGSRYTTVTGFTKAGAAYLFNSSGGLLFTFHEPTPAASDSFGWSVANAGGSILIGSPGTAVGGLAVAGAAYLYDSNANLLRTLHEPTPGAGYDFGLAVAGVGSNVVVGSPFASPGGSSYAGAAYYYRQFGLRDSCAAATGSDCLVVTTTGSFQAGSNTVAVNAVTISLRSARNVTLGTQMSLTIMCNNLVPTANIACSALYVDGNSWGPQRDPLTRSPFIIVNAEPYFYLTFHWWDPVNQRIFAWSYWWYGTSANTNWYWEVYLTWRSYVSASIGVWTPYWWYFWYWVYFQYWSFWTINVAP